MAIDLPALPKLTTVSPKLMLFNGTLTPSLGGPVQKVLRLGARYSLQVALPSLDADCGASWLGARLKAETEAATARLVWPQPPGSAPGYATVAGGGQLGSLLNVAATDGFTFKAGRFFSFTAGGRSYLHAVTADATATGGVAALPIGPMLRVIPDAGATLEFASPVIEGFFTDEAIEWSLDRLRFFGHSFTLAEAA